MRSLLINAVSLRAQIHLLMPIGLNSLRVPCFVSWVVIRVESKAHRFVGPFGILYRERVWQPVLDLFIATHRRVQTLPGVSSAFAEGE